MKKRLLSILLTACLLMGLLPTAALAAEGDVEYLYCDENGANWDTGTKSASEYTVVTSSNTAWGTSGSTTWYVVNSDVTIGSRVTVSGNVHLILVDGCTLTVNGGIQVQDNSTESTPNTNALTIYAQTQPVLDADGNVTNNVGKLIAQNAGVNAAIGGNQYKSGGSITINGGKITATSTDGAGIGGGSSYAEHAPLTITGGSGGSITINGGKITATSTYGAGIGGGYGADRGGNGDIITLNDGIVEATSTYGAGIGGGLGDESCGGNGGTITITGGTITATSTDTDSGAGIGGGSATSGKGGNGGEITISGGTVKATSNGNGAGIGGGYCDGNGGDGGTFQTTDNGNAVIFASSIADKTNQDSWSGVIFEDNSGAVYGTAVTPSEDFTIENEKTLTIDSGKTLTIPAGVTMTNSGTVDNSGTIYVDGALSGTVGGTGGVYYPLTVNGGTASGDVSTYQTKNYGKENGTVTLTGTNIPEGKVLDGWTTSDSAVTVENNAFTMPNSALIVTASYANTLTINTQPTANQTITYGQTATLSVEVNKHSSLTDPLTYQWYEGSTAITGATGSSYTTPADLTAGNHTYYCVITCGVYNVTSNTATVTINPLAEAAPDIAIDYENETLTGFVSGSKYTINSAEVTTVDGKLSVVDYIGSNINIVTKASDSNHADSTAQALNIPARPAAPTPTVKSKTSGSVTLEEIPGAQYSMDGGATWQDSPEFTGLSANTEYSFVARYGATESSFASPTSAELNVTTSAVSSGGGSSTPTYPPTVTQPDNGTVTVSPKSPKKGDTVTITPKPDAGYTVEQILVTDKNGNAVEVTNNGDGTYSFTQPAGKVNINVTFMEDNSMLNFFVDVPADAYYYDAVLWAAENGITGGVDDTHFSPNAPCTRAQIVTFLWRAAGCPEPESLTSLSDVPADAYYAKAVAWALENGITTGTGDGTTFSPNATCTRAQAMAFIYRSEQARGGGMQGAWMFLNPFDDVNLESYYGEAVMWAVANGVTDGTTATTFSPNANCTRAQIVTFLFRSTK